MAKNATQKTVGKALPERKKTGGAKVLPLTNQVLRSEVPVPLAVINSEHKYLSRLLVLLEEEADDLSRSGSCDFQCLNNIMDYMMNFPGKYHHPKEDLLFDRLKKISPKLKNIINGLTQHHHHIFIENDSLCKEIAALDASPSRVKARKLSAHILSYCSSMREHMQLEEAEIWPATKQLTKVDWQQIEKELKSISDPIFGPIKATKYMDLFERHINRFAVVATGAIPGGILESAATATERMVHTAMHLGRLPTKLMGTSRVTLKIQMDSLSELAKARDYQSLSDSIADCHRNFQEAGRLYMSQVLDALRAMEPEQEEDIVAPWILTTDDDFQAYEEKTYLPNMTARVSWQAATMNLFFRLSLKPMMSSIGIQNALRLKAFIQKNYKIPEGSCVVPIDGLNISATWVYPEGAQETTRTILWLPGGGFFFPATNGHINMLFQLTKETGCRGMMVNYRLAPDHPFPAGLEDAIAAYRHLLDIGVAPEDIVVGGDSAGGGMVLSLLLALRDEGLPMPCAGATISALADLSFSTPSRVVNKWRDPVLPTRRNLGAFDSYVGDTPKNDPLLSPAYGNFHGFPPMFAQVGSHEILLDDTLRVARKARSQGVDFELEIWEFLPHAWHLNSWIPESGKALSRIADFYRAHLQRKDSFRSIAKPANPRTKPARKRRVAKQE